MEAATPDTTPEIEPSRISPIQHPAMTWFMVTSTFGIYLSLFYYRQARDLKRLDGQPTTPWMWLLVPVISIAMPFAGSKMTMRYETLADRASVPFVNQGAAIGAGALLIFWGLEILSRTYSTYDGIGTVVAVFIVGGLFALQTSHINTYKRSLEPDRFLTSSKGWRIARGLATAILVLPLLALQGLLVYDSAANLLRPSAQLAGRWHHDTLPVSIQFEDNWRIAEIGDFSDGSADAEFSISEWEYIVIFDQSPSDDFHASLTSRRDLIMEESPDAECEEKRRLQDGGSVRVAQLICESTFLGDPVLEASIQLEDGSQHIELLYYAMTSRGSLPENRMRMQRILNGVRLETGEETQ